MQYLSDGVLVEDPFVQGGGGDFIGQLAVLVGEGVLVFLLLLQQPLPFLKQLGLMEAGIIRKPLDGLKVLGNGEITKKLTVEASVFSASAKEKIEAAGGKTEVV